ncbi:CRISPR-associated endoribonuclease Cas6 [Clostridium sp.]|jgi:CRISPR-associated endoribonuclease Cas6|uniref:CRISPR-associated endoribonuclease Cas6 n=1 Tax=Clostridium sp. TaxID=1506 RepID=UPI003A5BC510
MRLNITLEFDGNLNLPIQYNNIMQAVILNWLGDENYQKFIHDVGFKFKNRKYKLFTFSKIFGKFKINRENKTIDFFDNVNFTISSLEDKFLNYLAANVIGKDNFKFGNNIVNIKSIQSIYNKISNKEKVYTRSPIVVYSTFKNYLGNKTYYYSPLEREFSELIRKNLIHKYEAYYGQSPKDDEFSIQAINQSKLKQRVVLYKGYIIKGWDGEFLIQGSKELMNIAYNAGIGSKNSQGFGCIEIK